MNVYEKDHWRLTNLRFLESCKALWANGKFRFSYLELVGLSGSKMAELLVDRMDTPKQFIGVDLSFEAILYQRKNRVPWTTALVKDGYLTAERMASYTAAQREQIGIGPYPIAVYGFDDQASIGRHSWWTAEASRLRQIVAKTLEQTGVCCMILNNTLDRNPDRCTAVVEHTRQLCEAFGGWGLREEALLGRNRNFLPRIVENLSAGYFGGYQIYRSQGHPLRMATVRLEFTARGVRVWKGE